MKNWKETTVNLGSVKQNTTKIIKFESTRLLDIVSVTPGCPGCTKFVDYKDNILTIKYTADSVPKHLKNEGSTINKTVTIQYEDHTEETLSFIGFLKR